MLCLVARYNAEIIRWPIPRREAKLGSALDNDFVVPFPGVSRHHAAVSTDGNHLRLQDLKSKNGIIVGGHRVSEALLKTGDMATIGRATLAIEDARTSDVEIALSTASRPRTGSVSDTSADDRAKSDAAQALRLIRHIEAGGSKFSGRRRQQVLEQARGVLNAESIALCAVQRNGDVSIASVSGGSPGNDALLQGGTLYGGGQRKWHTATVKSAETTILFSGRAYQFLVAYFRSASPPWAEDLLGFMGEKLIGAPAGPDEPPASAAHSQYEMLVFPPGMVVGGSESMKRLMHQIAATISSKMDVLLLGETGTGKELLARMIHGSGPTRRGAFLAINCAAIPADLLEAELFGVLGRVATGVDPRPGLFAQANGGSILLDEIGELPERLQAKLLRVLQEREILPLGATVPRKIDVRVISASNRDLGALVEEGRFRADLYYRLRGLQFHIPPLRDRKDDIPALVMEYVTRAATEYGKVISGVSRHALHLLVEHDWPGNIRELENEIRRAVLICPSGGILHSDYLGTVRWNVERQRPNYPPAETAEAAATPTETHAAPASENGPSLRKRVEATERDEIERALAEAGGNQSRAARILGITRNGLALKLKRLGVTLARKAR